MLGSTSHGQETTRRPPNFILVFADDVSAFDFGSYGCEEHKTPNLDRMAVEGCRFETCWATPICTPSRVELLTGKYGFRTNVYHNAMRYYWNEPGGHIGENHLLFPEWLKQQGYATCLTGKWQLDGAYPEKVYDFGFDEYRMHHEWMYELPEGVTFDGLVETEDHLFPGRTSLYWHPCIFENGKLLETKPDDYGPDLYADFLIDFMGRHKDQPFLAYYPMGLAHTQADFLGTGEECNVPVPVRDADGKWTGQRSPVGLKYNVEYIDYLVGRIWKSVEDLGLAEDTILLFVGDNASNRFAKATPVESACRVPFIAYGPGHVKPQGVTRALTDLSDLMPTLAHLAGAPLGDATTVDGSSQAPVLRGETDSVRPWIFSFLAYDRFLRDEHWFLDADGRFYDCSVGRNVSEYREVTGSTDPDVVAARRRFEKILEGLPAPPRTGPLAERYHEQWEVGMSERVEKYEERRGKSPSQ